MTRIIFFFIFFIFFHFIGASASEYWNVKLYKKDSNYKEEKNLYLFNENGFYLYKNCVYTFGLNNGNELICKLIDIKQDTIEIKILKFENNDKIDGKILSIHFNEINYFKLLADRYPDRYSIEYINDYIIEFIKEESERKINSKFEKIYTNDEELYELIPRITYDEVDYLYISYGNLYEFKGNELEKADTTFKSKDYFWFTPNYINEINGLAIGVWTSTFKNKKSEIYETLIINGVNLELNPMGIILTFKLLLYAPPLTIPYPDSLEQLTLTKNNLDYIINGLNFNYGIPFTGGSINGFNLIGVFGSFYRINGLSITGLSNYTYIFNGINISGLYNRSIEHNGVQIGLVNKANKLRGVQIGLWNINNKRSLPIINWNFTE